MIIPFHPLSPVYKNGVRVTSLSCPDDATVGNFVTHFLAPQLGIKPDANGDLPMCIFLVNGCNVFTEGHKHLPVRNVIPDGAGLNMILNLGRFNENFAHGDWVL
jgi:hypothetical protein